ncbi:hypothetical protein ISCGN_002136 [Ixodes scapularis]
MFQASGTWHTRTQSRLNLKFYKTPRRFVRLEGTDATSTCEIFVSRCFPSSQHYFERETNGGGAGQQSVSIILSALSGNKVFLRLVCFFFFLFFFFFSFFFFFLQFYIYRQWHQSARGSRGGSRIALESEPKDVSFVSLRAFAVHALSRVPARFSITIPSVIDYTPKHFHSPVITPRKVLSHFLARNRHIGTIIKHF